MVAQQCGTDRLLQFRGAIDVGVTGFAAQCGGMRGCDHMVRRCKVEIARRQLDDVAAGRAQLAGAAAQDRCGEA